jgi:flagellar biosynthesis protein
VLENAKSFLKKAIALAYSPKNDDAPKVVANGRGELAKQIISIAEQNNIPIKKDEDLIELLSKLEINDQIPPNLYKAIAEIFKFVYELKGKSLTHPQES